MTIKYFKILLIIVLCFLLARLVIINYNQPNKIIAVLSQNQQKNPYYIFVDLDEYKMYIFKDSKVYKTYPVSGGKPKTPSPIGTWKIVSKAHWGEGFGGTWMGFNVPWGKYGIHGTDEPWSIGKPLSKGCIRMFNDDAQEVKDYIPIGTKVTIVKGSFGLFGSGFRTLRNGDRGSDVYAVQLRLRGLGYYHGYPDGKFGNGLEDAIVRFCKDNKLYVRRNITMDLYEAMGFIPFE